MDEHSLPDLSRYRPRQRRLALARWECVQRFLAARAMRDGALMAALPDLLAELRATVAAPLKRRHGDRFGVSRASLYRWVGKCRTAADVEQLVDTRGGDSRATGSAEFWRAFGRLYADGAERSVAECWRKASVAARAGGIAKSAIPSYKSVLRRLRKVSLLDLVGTEDAPDEAAGPTLETAPGPVRGTLRPGLAGPRQDTQRRSRSGAVNHDRSPCDGGSTPLRGAR